jgi:pyridoxamine 5'-phosphate oxidase-like protein
MRTIGAGTGGESQEIPASHRDLVECAPVATLATVTADGYPHTSVVWCGFDGGCIRLNTMRGSPNARFSPGSCCNCVISMARPQQDVPAYASSHALTLASQAGPLPVT